MANSGDLVMSDICYECSEDGVCLSSFHCIFVDKEVRCTKSETKDGFLYRNYQYQVIQT